jgi:UrcA family protein
MFRTNSMFLLVVTATFLATSANAQQITLEPKRRTVPVTFGDLNLDKPSDARALLSRLEEAAKEACGPRPSHDSLYGVIPEGLERTYKECREGAVGNAVARLNAPLVSRFYAESRAKKPSDVAKR